ncbi:hypothetical protein HYU21_04520 [Candidatus Woesearchaeota archaeon]|nr:hypothetical protein [Candidatus Woesearchaeota archaeon]
MDLNKSIYGFLAGMLSLAAVPLQANAEIKTPSLSELLSPSAYQFVLSKWNEAGVHLFDADKDETVDFAIQVPNIPAERRNNAFRRICSYVPKKGPLVSDYSLNLTLGRCNKQGLESKIESNTTEGKVDSLTTNSYDEKGQLVKIENVSLSMGTGTSIRNVEEITYHDNGRVKTNIKYALNEAGEKVVSSVQEYDIIDRIIKSLSYQRGKLRDGEINNYLQNGQVITERYTSHFLDECKILRQSDTYAEDIDCDGKWDNCEAPGEKIRPCNEGDKLGQSIFLNKK